MQSSFKFKAGDLCCFVSFDDLRIKGRFAMPIPPGISSNFPGHRWFPTAFPSAYSWAAEMPNLLQRIVFSSRPLRR